MNKWKCALIVVVTLLLASPALAQSPARVAVAPFQVFSQVDLGYLGPGVQEMVVTRLLEIGVKAISEDELAQAADDLGDPEFNESVARKVGLILKADFVVFGSLTKVGDRLSLDAQVVDVLGIEPSVSVFVQEDGLVNVNQAAGRLAQEIALVVSGEKKIVDVEISGNDRIEDEAILRILKTQPGDIFMEERLSQDLKRIYDLGYFDDVKIDVEDTETGKTVAFIVDEKPVVQRITFRGNRAVEKDKLMDVLGYPLYSILSTKKIAQSVENMYQLYREKGFYNAKIDYEVEVLGPKRAEVTYRFQEGRKVYVESIEFLGNQAYSDAQLRRKMKTKQGNFLSWVLGTGVLEEDKLKEDVKRLAAWYLIHGYLDVKIGDPDVELEQKGIYITIPVEEGPQYRVGDISVTGDVVVPKETLFENMELEEGAVLNRKFMHEDEEMITNMVADKGYAFAEVTPLTNQRPDENIIDINYNIEKKGLVYFERISITGNTKTRDKVIRRELRVKEGALYSSQGLRYSQMNLDRLGYFKEVQINQSKGSEENRMNLEVKVEEQPTGNFSVGAGYSSFDALFGQIAIEEDNLFGRGQKVRLSANVGSQYQFYNLSFTEPWLFDIPLNAGFDLFNTNTEYDTYRKLSTGGALRASYPILPFTRLSGRYLFELADVRDINYYAAQEIKDQEGQSTTSSLMGMIRRDTRNHFFTPTDGSNNWFSAEVAGGIMGGTNAYYRLIGNSGWYFPLWWESWTFYVRAKAGVMFEGPGDLPVYEKFYLGGIKSVRGFEWGDIGPRDPVTGDYIGGQSMFQLNMEVGFPLFEDAGISGVVFFDQGNAWEDPGDIDPTDLKRSVGAGFRYLSPFGPMRIEYGWVINPDERDPNGNWEFAVGGQF